jgi:hypothetical protein
VPDGRGPPTCVKASSAPMLESSVIGCSVALTGNSNSGRVTGKVLRMELFLCGRKEAASKDPRRWSSNRSPFSNKHKFYISSFMLILSAFTGMRQ